jgi:hypothetical protein
MSCLTNLTLLLYNNRAFIGPPKEIVNLEYLDLCRPGIFRKSGINFALLTTEQKSWIKSMPKVHICS